MKEYWKAWILPALIRCLHTMAQTAIGVIGAAKLISEVNWPTVISAVLLAGIVSLIKSAAVGMPELERPEVHDD